MALLIPATILAELSVAYFRDAMTVLSGKILSIYERLLASFL